METPIGYQPKRPHGSVRNGFGLPATEASGDPCPRHAGHATPEMATDLKATLTMAGKLLASPNSYIGCVLSRSMRLFLGRSATLRQVMSVEGATEILHPGSL